MLRRLALSLSVLAHISGCAVLQDHGAGIAAGVGAARTASELNLLTPEFIAGGLVAYAIYDPLAPTWKVSVTRLDDERVRLDLSMRALITGGDGEARQIFMRNARQLAEANGFAGFDVMRYEEAVESSRPFAHRVANGEIRLVRSRIWPTI